MPSRARFGGWWAGYPGTLVAVVTSLVAYWINSTRDPLGLYPVREAALNQMTANFVPLFFLLAVVLYVGHVPIPAGTIWVSPSGSPEGDRTETRRLG
jgi:hypothetical protein